MLPMKGTHPLQNPCSNPTLSPLLIVRRDFRLELESQLSRLLFGGEGGIRTHGPVAGTHAFQACRFVHSRTSPSTNRKGKFSMHSNERQGAFDRVTQLFYTAPTCEETRHEDSFSDSHRPGPTDRCLTVPSFSCRSRSLSRPVQASHRRSVEPQDPRARHQTDDLAPNRGSDYRLHRHGRSVFHCEPVRFVELARCRREVVAAPHKEN